MKPAQLPNPLFDYMQLYWALLPVASLFVAAGLLGAFSRSGALQDQLTAIVRVTAIVALLAFFDPAVQGLKTGVQAVVEEKLKAKPEELPRKLNDKLLASESAEAPDGLWDQVTKFGTQFFHAMLVALITLVALVALALFYIAYLAQELALEMGIGLSPLFVGFLLLPATRAIGAQFLLYMLAIALFPIGWGAASLVSDSIIDFATARDAAQTADLSSSMSFAMRNFFGALLLSVWIIVSTFVAPFAMLKAVTTGVHLSSDAFRALRFVLRR